MFIFFFRRISYRFLELFCLVFLCATILTFKSPSYLQNFLSRNSNAQEIERANRVLKNKEQNLKASLKLTLASLSFQPGYSKYQRSSIKSSIQNAFVVTLSLMVPSLFLGIFLSLFFSFLSLHSRGALKHFSSFSLLLLTGLSEVILILFVKALLCSKQGLNLLPFHGWECDGFSSYLKYASGPILVLSLSLLCLYGPLLLDFVEKEMKASYTKTLRSMGCSSWRIFFIYQLKAILPPALTHLARLAPSYIVGGSLLVENHFAIPGLGFLTYESCVTGDKETLLMVVTLVAISYLLLQELLELTLYFLQRRFSLA